MAITYNNKVANGGATADGKWSAANANEVKSEVNAVITTANAAVPNTRTVNTKALSSDITLTPSDIGTYSTSQIDALIAGLKWKNSVKVATTANGTLASAYANGQTVDGVTLVTGDRILLKNQTTQTENGIYTVNASGAPTRATDADSGTELQNATVGVDQGTANADTSWRQTTDNITIGSSNIVWTTLNASAPAANGTTAGIAKLYPSTSLGTNTDGAPDQNAVKAYVDAQVAAGAPAASPTTAGIMKKYTTTGSNTDGTMTQQAITNAIGPANVGNLLYLYNNFK